MIGPFLWISRSPIRREWNQSPEGLDRRCRENFEYSNRVFSKCSTRSYSSGRALFWTKEVQPFKALFVYDELGLHLTREGSCLSKCKIYILRLGG